MNTDLFCFRELIPKRIFILDRHIPLCDNNTLEDNRHIFLSLFVPQMKKKLFAYIASPMQRGELARGKMYSIANSL
jgi:hypothetical protein